MKKAVQINRIAVEFFLPIRTKFVCHLGFVLLVLSTITGCSSQTSPSRTEVDRTAASKNVIVAEAIQFTSAILGEDREVLIAVPEGYADSDASYPVLYVLDGRQNLPHVLGSADVLTRTGGMPPTIIIGITGANRDRDYSTSTVDSIPTSGGGAKFLSFIEEELIPFVDQNYRTVPFKAFEGHSLGGALATHALMSNTNLFDAYIIMSPALWWDDRALITRAKTFFEAQTSLPKAVFLGIGTQDGYEMRQDLSRLAAIADEASIQDMRLAHQEFDAEGHMSAPLQTNYFGLKHIFADLRPANLSAESFDVDEFIAHENYIRKKYGANARQTAETYARLSFRLQEAGKFADAIAVLEQNAKSYPGYHRNYWWLASAHEKNSDLQAALTNYKRGAVLAAKSGDPMLEQYEENIDRISATITVHARQHRSGEIQ